MGAEKRKGAGPRSRHGGRQTRSAKPSGGAAALDGEWDAASGESSDPEFERESRELADSSRTLTRVLLFVFLGIAVLMVVVAVLTGVTTSRKLAREKAALAQVTEMTERKGSDGNSFFYPKVAFDVPDGGRFNVQLAEGSWPPAYRVGDLVTVRYDGQNPLDARIASGGGTSALWTWTLVTGVLGIAFLGAAVLAWAMGRSDSS